MLGQTLTQTSNFRCGQIRAGRIVGIGQEDDLGPLGHRRQHIVDRGRQLHFFRRHRHSAAGTGGNGIHQEPVAGMQNLVAGASVAAAQQAQHIVRTRPQNNPLRVQIIASGNSLTQSQMPAHGIIGIAMDFSGQGGISLHRLGAGAKRAFV